VTVVSAALGPGALVSDLAVLGWPIERKTMGIMHEAVEDIARSATLTASPRLAVERLVELRARIDTLIGSQGAAWLPLKEGIMQTRRNLQRRARSPDAGDSSVAKKHCRPPDRGAAG
jgi:hypothetical protein